MFRATLMAAVVLVVYMSKYVCLLQGCQLVVSLWQMGVEFGEADKKGFAVWERRICHNCGLVWHVMRISLLPPFIFEIIEIVSLVFHSRNKPSYVSEQRDRQTDRQIRERARPASRSIQIKKYLWLHFPLFTPMEPWTDLEILLTQQLPQLQWNVKCTDSRKTAIYELHTLLVTEISTLH